MCHAEKKKSPIEHKVPYVVNALIFWGRSIELKDGERGSQKEVGKDHLKI